MNIDWRPLDAELERWTSEQPLPIWWRDDDAVTQSAAIDRLRALSGTFDLPIHLAIIPAHADQTLAELLVQDSRLIPLVHGWTHENHAPPGQKKAEFRAHRPIHVMRQDILNARDRLSALIGTSVPPVFVPPWNRIAPELLPALPDLGFTAVSTYEPRKSAFAAPGLAQINTHLDPIDWRGARSIVDPNALIIKTAGQLADRRCKRADASEPYGILTHHLVHDEPIWALTQEILSRFTKSHVTHWTASGETANEPT